MLHRGQGRVGPCPTPFRMWCRTCPADHAPTTTPPQAKSTNNTVARNYCQLCDWTARSNQSILQEINREYSWEGLMLKLKLQYFGPPHPDAGQD